jgi:hypothetical protein
MSDLALYHVSQETPIQRGNLYKLGKLLDACITCKAFIVGYNILEVANGEDLVLLALTMREDESNIKGFELMTNLKLVKVERKQDGNREEPS